MYNAGERKDIRKAEKAARVVDMERVDFVRHMMSMANGRSYIWNILESCSVFSSTFTPDPGLTAFNEGRRSLGLQILADLMAHCPDQYILMSREANVRRSSDYREPDLFDATDPAAFAERGSSPYGYGRVEGREADYDPYDATGEEGREAR